MAVSAGVAVDATGYLGVDRTSTYVLSSAEERQVAAVPWAGAGAAAVRSGIVPGSGSITPVSATASAWSISPCKIAFSDGAGGVWEINLATTKTENMPTAPGAGNTRYDALVIEPFDTGSIAGRYCKLRLYSGTAAGSPSLAATLALVPAGAYVVATMLTANTGAPVVTQALPRTVAAGGIVPVGSLTPDLAALLTYDGMAAYQEDVDVFLGRANGVWRGLGGAPLVNSVLNTSIGTAVGAATWTTEASGLAGTFVAPTANVRVTMSAFLTGTGNETRFGFKISGGTTRDPTADEAAIIVVANGSGSTLGRTFLLTGLAPGTSYTLSSAVYNSTASTVTANYRRLMVEAA